ncbi:MAG: (Fe-S)-binding protein [Acidimicrobiales bacterium]|nr:(Fe-S)-binding protein [Acidimicrobiales bacterium]
MLRGMQVALMITCLVDVFEPGVADATVEVLTAAGCAVTCPLGQTCCGQPAWNAGFAEDAARVARTTLAALEGELAAGAEAIVAPAGSCTAMVRVFWPELFETVGDPEAAERARAVAARTWELTELLGHLDLPPLALAAPTRVAWHHSCHLLRELGAVDGPGALLATVEGCERVSWSADERCCGFGGMFSFKLPEVAVAMADDKLASLADAAPRADVVVGSDSSCLIHLRGRAEAEGRPIRTQHVAELIAAALPSTEGVGSGAGEPA